MKFRPNYSWPATLSFSAENGNENERFSRGKLRVFFKGETQDHRLFSEQFSEEVIKSLPYTPIVSYYDEEKDDFVGHATEQAIYGIVDPCSEVSFEKMEDGNTWAVCDTVYYTERPGKVGEIAKKIEGHSQSLELDPKTAKYVINYDEKKHFKNLEFTAGHFIGVSVLGKDQKPAFTGSEFFALDTFEEKMQILRDYCEAQKNDQTSGGTEMNLTEFIKLSWGEKAQKICDAVDAEYGKEYFNYMVDCYDDRVIMRFYSYFDGSSKLMGINYSIDEDGNVSLGNIEEVHITYENVPAPASTNATEEQGAVSLTSTEESATTTEVEDNSTTVTVAEIVTESEIVTEPINASEASETEAEETSVSEENAEPVNPTEATIEVSVDETDPTAATSSTTAQDAAQPINAQDTQMKEVGADDEQTQEENSSPAPLDHSERAELEALKRAQKEELLNSYKDNLSEEEYNGFFATIDDKTPEVLELEILKLYKTKVEENPRAKQRRVFALSSVNNKNATTKDSLAQDIKYYLNRD